MTEVDLNPDNAHHPERTARTADVMSDCVRILNYAVAHGGLHHASDGYRLLGELREAAWREVELLDRLARWSREQATMGAWKVDPMGKPEEIGPRVNRAIESITAAQRNASLLCDHLSEAQNAFSRIANTADADSRS